MQMQFNSGETWENFQKRKRRHRRKIIAIIILCTVICIGIVIGIVGCVGKINDRTTTTTTTTIATTTIPTTKTQVDSGQGISSEIIFYGEFGTTVTTNTTTTTIRRPHYIPEGFEHLDGSIEQDDYRIIDNKGNIFTYISGGGYVSPFYISSFEISKDEDGCPRSVPGAQPWVDITWSDARKVAQDMGGDLMSKNQYLAMCEMLKTKYGYENIQGFYRFGKTIMKTGSGQVLCGISDIGNTWAWMGHDTPQIFGGNDPLLPMIEFMSTDSKPCKMTGFRVVL